MAQGHQRGQSRWNGVPRRALSAPGKITAGLPFLVLAVALASVLAAIALATAHTGSHVASGSGNGNSSAGQPTQPARAQATKTCGFPGLPACPIAQPVWIPLASTAPADIVAAARKSPLIMTVSSGQGDTVDVTRLGTPVLVRAYLISSSNPLPDYYDIPARDASGATIGVVLCTLNSQHTAISVDDIVGYSSPRSAGTITTLSAQDAVNAVSSQTHVAPRAGAAAELIYFPFDQMAEDTGKINWKAGGNTPYDPMWLVPGADGQDHLVGSDGHVYAPSQLPVKQG